MRASLALLFLAGCGHTTMAINNAQPSAPVAGSVNATGAIAAVVLVTTAVAATKEPQPMPSLSVFPDWTPRPAPAMAPEREIAEQDCTKPVDLTGNLRCR